MVASTQITHNRILAFIVDLVFKLLGCKVLFINRKDKLLKACQKNGTQDPESTQDPGPYDDPGHFEDPGRYEDPAPYENAGP